LEKTVLITGASRGIGLALARRLAARGDRVVATARDPNAASALHEASEAAAPGWIEIRELDVTDPDAVEDLAGKLDRVDLLICNAGQYRARGGIESPDHTREAWESVLMTNIAGVFFTARGVLPRLAAAETPKIAVISSIMASSANAPGGSHLYRASKAAATNLARNLAVDLKPRGIAVGAYHPGWVRTDMGGAGANISVEESAAGLVARFDALSLETTGVFEDYRGHPMSF